MSDEGANFRPDDYWEQRLTDVWGLDSVGDKTLGLGFNRSMYRVRAHAFKRQVAELGVPVQTCDVLDIGSGTGFYIALWQELGARTVTGSDLTGIAVTNLRRTHPGTEIRQLDITARLPATFGPDGSFDIVSAYDVFFHIVDDALFDKALANIASLLRPGGLLLFSDSLKTGPGGRHGQDREHIVFRRLDEVVERLAGKGLLMVDQRPAFVLMNAPIDSTSRWRHVLWSLVSLATRCDDTIGRAVGSVMMPLELQLLARTKTARGVRMFACRRADFRLLCCFRGSGVG